MAFPRGLDLSGKLTDSDANDPLMNSPAQSFNLILKKGTTYTIDMKSKEFDPYLRLENMAGVNLKNEDVGGNGHSTLVVVPTQDGIYRLIGTTYDFKTGPFTLTVREGRPGLEVGPKGLNVPGVLNLNDPLDIRNGKATKARCKVLDVALKAGQKYQIDMVSNQFDSFLRVEDSKGAELAFDDDSGGNLNARLIFAPPADGVYRLIATHFDGRYGAFNLLVRPLLPEQGAAFWLQRGKAQLKAGQWDLAIDDLTKAIDADASVADIWNDRGVAYFRKGQWAQAAADFSKALEQNPNNPIYWANRADALASLAQWDKVIADLSKSLELNQAVPARWNMRGVAYFRKGQWELALADFSAAIERAPENPLFLTNRGNSLAKLKKWDKAIADYSKVIEIKPDHDVAWLERGFAQGSLDQWDRASEDLTKAGSFPGTFFKAWSNHALLRLQLKDDPGYRQTCARLKEKWTDKEDPQLMVWVCSIAPNSGVDLGPMIKALEEKTTGKAVASYANLRALGAALYRSGKSKEAIRKLEEAASRKQPSPAAWIFLAMAYHQLQQKDEAQKSLDKAKKDADPKAASWSSLLWTERIPLELLLREAEELLKTSSQ